MPKITVLPHAEICPQGAEFDAKPGESICRQLLDHGIEIEHIVLKHLLAKIR
jgi:2Fe-2S ferredoxin